MKALNGYLKRLHARIKENRGVFILYTILRVLVFVALVRNIMIQNYEGAAVCALSLALFLIPSFLEGALKVEIAPLFEGAIYIFIFAAEILGELKHFYTTYPMWDTMLHTTNGFLFAAVGFATVDLLNRNNKNVNLSPLYLTMVAFCFSMTIGVMWEFIECGGDLFLAQDMQKDFIVQTVNTVKLDPTQTQQVIHINDIVRTDIITAAGEVVTVEGGYLDVGILDTMKDLGVNFLGAVVFCTLGFIYLHSGTKGKIASPVVEGLRIQPTPDPVDPSK